ncbi:MAG: hypothetical protein ACM3PX_11930 [Omnitrophica WOR_2 bacterium]
MKKDINILIISVWILVILSSCSGNNIYFDIKSQSVKTCNKRIITSLWISSKGQSDDYCYLSKLPEKNGTNTFSLVKLDADYIIESIDGEILWKDTFKLRPETEYEIVNSTFGDAAHAIILIKTDKEGKVIYSDVTSCK